MVGERVTLEGTLRRAVFSHDVSNSADVTRGRVRINEVTENLDPASGMAISDFKPDAVVDAKKKNHAWAMIVPGLSTNANYTACFEGPECTSAPASQSHHALSLAFLQEFLTPAPLRGALGDLRWPL